MGALEMERLSLKSLSGEGLEGGGGAPSLVTLEDMLRKAPDMDISLSTEAPLQLRGTWNMEGGSYTRDFES